MSAPVALRMAQGRSHVPCPGLARFDVKAGTLSRNSLKHIKTFISAVFKLAKQQGYYMGENPVRDTAISPKATEPQETYAYDLNEIQSMLPCCLKQPRRFLRLPRLRASQKRTAGLLWENYQDG